MLLELALAFSQYHRSVIYWIETVAWALTCNGHPQVENFYFLWCNEVGHLNLCVFCGQADYMHWIFDNIPDQSILNTAGWRYIVPQLYEKYPNDDMNLNISVSSPPIIKVAKDDINAFVNLDVTIDVIDSGEVIPAACISLVNLFEISVWRSCKFLCTAVSLPLLDSFLLFFSHFLGLFFIMYI